MDEIEELVGKKEDLMERISKMKSFYSKKQSKLKNELNLDKRAWDNLNDDKTDVDQQIQSINTEIINLKKKIEKKRQEFEKGSKANLDLLQQKKKLNEEIEEKNDVIGELDRKIEKNESKIHQMEKTLSKIS